MIVDLLALLAAVLILIAPEAAHLAHRDDEEGQ